MRNPLTKTGENVVLAIGAALVLLSVFLLN